MKQLIIGGPVLIAIAALLWSFDGLLRVSLYTLPPLEIIFWEHLLGFLILLPVVIKSFSLIQHSSRLTKFSLVWVAFFGGLIGTLAYTAALSQVKYIEFSVVVLLQKLQPIFAITLSWLVLKETISRRFIILALVALFGAYLVSFPDLAFVWQANSNYLIAVGLAILAAFGWGSSTVFGRQALQGLNQFQGVGWRFGLTLVLTLALLILTGQTTRVLTLSADQFLTILAITLSTGMVAMVIYYQGLKKTEAHIATIVEMVWPVSAILLDWFLFHKQLAPSQLFGAAILLIAMFFITQAPRVSQARPTSIMKKYTSTLQSGRGEGTKLGFPTLNLAIPPEFSVPKGIYAGYVWLNNTRYKTAFHYGPVPLFNQSEPSLEAHVINQQLASNKYEKVTFQLIKRLRAIKQFSSPEELARQIKKDCQQTLSVLK